MGEPKDKAADLSAAVWFARFDDGWSLDADRAALGRLVDDDGDEYETELYEHAADPQALLIDRAQRRKAGQRRLQAKRRQELLREIPSEE